MIVLPPDITTSLTAFGSAEAINSLPRREQVIRKCLIQQSIFNLFTLLVFKKIIGKLLHQEAQVGFQPTVPV